MGGTVVTAADAAVRWPRHVSHGQLLRPTLRLCGPQLSAVAAVLAAATTAGIVAGSRGVALPGAHVRLLVAALAVAAAWPLDPAANLLAPLPVGPRLRLAVRTLLATAIAVVGWIVAGRLVDVTVAPPAMQPALGGSVPTVLALVTVGVVVGRLLGPWGACAPLALVSTALLFDPPAGLADVLQLWATHPWPVVVLGAAIAAARE